MRPAALGWFPGGRHARVQRTAPAAGSAGAAAETLAIPPDSTIPAGPLGAAIRRGRALLAHTPRQPPGLRRQRSALLQLPSRGRDPGRRAPADRGVLALPAVPRPQRAGQSAGGPDQRLLRAEPQRQGAAADRPGHAGDRGLLRPSSPGGSPHRVWCRAGARTRCQAERPIRLRGAALFAATCTRCHGAEGLGTPVAPPLWGPRSFNIGAGMARLWTAAAFIRDNMPNDRAVASPTSRRRRGRLYRFPAASGFRRAKERDWPNGNPPPDVAYPTRRRRSRLRAFPRSHSLPCTQEVFACIPSVSTPRRGFLARLAGAAAAVGVAARFPRRPRRPGVGPPRRWLNGLNRVAPLPVRFSRRMRVGCRSSTCTTTSTPTRAPTGPTRR